MPLLTELYRTFLIDWDGTLANTIGVWLDLLVETYAEYGKYPEPSFLMEKSFGNWDAPKEFGIENVDEFNSHLFSKVDAKFSTAPLFPTSKQLLSELKQQQKQLALITSNVRSVIDAALEHHQLTGVFDLIISSDDVSEHKPDPEGIHAAIKALGAEPASTVMVGDSSNDVLAGKAAGIRTVLLYPDVHRQIYSPGYIDSLNADHVLSHPADVLTLKVDVTSSA
ncbi:MAG: Pyrophosphatase PpaX [candidate division WS6 bacterium OLB20]|uniref:Pyrophosphatase PpaX n=1 Tax=candidate division WS6 bacterium OLB20 TaxID=1617426 RepID=A0A136M0Z0_9BACT|nr:MAG: Pyrophosphatase PpaX [candidate division WS6 bacterium OLB20]